MPQALCVPGGAFSQVIENTGIRHTAFGYNFASYGAFLLLGPKHLGELRTTGSAR
jgi:hypothetical protein